MNHLQIYEIRFVEIVRTCDGRKIYVKCCNLPEKYQGQWDKKCKILELAGLLTHSLTHSLAQSMVQQDIIWKADSHSAC
jgi:DNA-binding IscR family transcriptional regulator